MPETLHILIVDDDPKIRRLLVTFLTEEGFCVSEAENGRSMREQFASGQFDLVLMDLVLPGEDGLSLARQLRAHSNIPIIMLTGKGDAIDRVIGLEVGADDYISKPFVLREVLARIRAVLRRTTAAAASSDPPVTATHAASGDAVYSFDSWRLDVDRRLLEDPTGQAVPLTSGEFDLLATLVKSPNRVLSRDQLMNMTRNRDWTPFDRTIDTQVRRLRKKIESDPANPQIIQTVRGVGYVFASKVEHR